MQKRHQLVMAGAILGVVISAWAPVSGVGPSFRPDTRFSGSTLTGWTPLGAASWRAENGEIVGTPKSAAGGWLILNQSFQDVGLYARFRCAEGCQAGIMFRAEKTAQGMKGIYLNLAGGDFTTH